MKKQSRTVVVSSVIALVFCGLYVLERMKRSEAEQRVEALEVRLKQPQPVSGERSPECASQPESEPVRDLPLSPTPRRAVPEEVVSTDSDGEKSAAARIRAVEQFVQLDDQQRSRLAEKFRSEFKASPGENPATESLEEILSEEGAAFYREERERAFKKSELEEQKKEAYYLSRVLELSSEQEDALLNSLQEIETYLAEIRKESLRGRVFFQLSRREQLELTLLEIRERGQLLQLDMNRVLQAQQFEQFLEYQASSSAADMEMFHQPAGEAQAGDENEQIP